jgi:hypothetical protein
MWYVMKKGGTAVVTDYGLGPMKVIPSLSAPAIGRCRRHSPTMSGFPVVFFKDWCGDHKLDEDKI